MNTPSNTQAQIEQNQTLTIDDLHQAFAEVCFYYGAINMYGMDEKAQKDRFRWFAEDSKKLADIAMQLHSKVCGGVQ